MHHFFLSFFFVVLNFNIVIYLLYSPIIVYCRVFNSESTKERKKESKERKKKRGETETIPSYLSSI